MSQKRVYFFGAGEAEGRGDQKELLGGKGAGLAEMYRIGIPVPPGFTITTEMCAEYQQTQELSSELKDDVTAALHRVEEIMGKTFVDAGGVTVKFFRAPRFDLTELVATHVGEGIYEATLPFRYAGSYYVYVAAPGLNVGYKDLNYKTVLVVKAETPQAARR